MSRAEYTIPLSTLQSRTNKLNARSRTDCAGGEISHRLKTRKDMASCGTKRRALTILERNRRGRNLREKFIT